MGRAAPRGTASRREVAGYCLYDFANSSYTTLIVTVAYAIYFRQVVVGAGDPRGDLWWSLTQVAAYLVLIVSAPVFGALADCSGRKKLFLLGTTIQTVVACALLSRVGAGDLGWAVGLYIAGTVGFEGGYVFYNAFLPEVSTPATAGRVSGWAWGLGFAGGLAALAACAPFLRGTLVDEQGQIVPETARGYSTSFLLVALFFAIFAAPALALLRERAATRPAPASLTEYVRVGFTRVGDTLSGLSRQPEIARFLVGAVFFYGGIEAVIKFSGIYATRTFGFTAGELTLLFVFANLVAIPGTLLAGYIADWVGPRPALIATLVGWVALLLFGAATTTRAGFWALTGGVSIGVGATQAVARTFMARASPPHRISEFFGFYLLAGKAGAILAFLIFGLVSAGTGSQRTAVLWLVPLFLAGLIGVLRASPSLEKTSKSRKEFPVPPRNDPSDDMRA